MARIIILLLMHVVADFFLQGNKLSKLKALKSVFLLEHVAIYTAFFMILSPFLLGLTVLQSVIFSLINGVLHLVIDYFTGKFKTKYFQVDDSKYMAAIGVDHTLHLILLFATYLFIFPDALNSAYLLN